MPQVITDRELLLSVVKSLDLTSELFIEVNGKLKNANDLEVIIEGKTNASGMKGVGPYFRLFRYQSGEEIMRQGEWGGDTFFIAVAGKLDVWVKDATAVPRRIGEVEPGTCFGEISVLTGIERNATILVPAGASATVLQIDRPALRLLRKLPKFGPNLDDAYLRHGKGSFFEELGQVLAGPLSREIIDRLSDISKFAVYGKGHILCEEGRPAKEIILVKNGWVRRVRGIPSTATDSAITMAIGENIGVDFLGVGNCLGLELTQGEDKWKYSAAAMAHTEVLEVPIADLTADPLADQIIAALSALSHAHSHLPATIDDSLGDRVLGAVEAEIRSGLIDGANLLVMDMDLCVRCGNCSLACHKVHGQSRLVRRGIQITRPARLAGRRTQTLLSPQVCLHCKDALCLTGCPTGAIHRDPRGHIEINPEACFGCFDCATQCPYDAIAMVPRKAISSTRVAFDLMGSLKKSLSLTRGEPSPLHITPADDVVAINCNLCENTSLNPLGAKRKAYSCQENCPTGALVRVDPLKYFSEVDSTLGFVFRDKKHAVGRNIHQKDPLARMWHIGGAMFTVLLAIVAAWGLSRHGYSGHILGTRVTMRWATGVIGLISIVIVMAYPLRKQIYRRRAGALRYWLLAHIYIGALGAATLLVHAGTHTGGLLTTLLYLSFVGVVVTGLCGLTSYIVAPRLLTSMEGEPLLIEDLTARRTELRNELAEISNNGESWLRERIAVRVTKRFLTRKFLLRQFLRRETLKSLVAQAREMFKEDSFGTTSDAEKSTLLHAVETAVTLRRVDALILLHRTLRIWIAPHVISTSLMLALMLVHITDVVFIALK